MNIPATHTVRQRPRAERLEARISPEQKSFLQQAASIQGRSLTDFIIGSAQETAARILRDYEVIALNTKDRDLFIGSLLKTPIPNRRLLAAARRYKKWRDSSR